MIVGLLVTESFAIEGFTIVLFTYGSLIDGHLLPNNPPIHYS